MYWRFVASEEPAWNVKELEVTCLRSFTLNFKIYNSKNKYKDETPPQLQQCRCCPCWSICWKTRTPLTQTSRSQKTKETSEFTRFVKFNRLYLMYSCISYYYWTKTYDSWSCCFSRFNRSRSNYIRCFT